MLLLGRCDSPDEGNGGGVHTCVGAAENVGGSEYGGSDISGHVGRGGGERRGRRVGTGVMGTDTRGGRPTSGDSSGSSEGSSDGSSEGSSESSGDTSGNGAPSSGLAPGRQWGTRAWREVGATRTSRRQWRARKAFLREGERKMTWRRKVGTDRVPEEKRRQEANAGWVVGGKQRAQSVMVIEDERQSGSKDAASCALALSNRRSIGTVVAREERADKQGRGMGMERAGRRSTGRDRRGGTRVARVRRRREGLERAG